LELPKAVLARAVLDNPHRVANTFSCFSIPNGNALVVTDVTHMDMRSLLELRFVHRRPEGRLVADERVHPPSTV
jgi:hypothetical protein